MMRSSVRWVLAAVAAAVMCSQAYVGQARAEDRVQLDMAAYLAAADPKAIYPSAAQKQMLAPFVPAARYRPAPPIGDRVFWASVGQRASARAIVVQAQKDLGVKPEVPITDAIYRRANKEGNRGIYKRRYYRTMERLERAVIAECVENQGTFLPTIEEHARAILAMKSWLHPNHDRRNEVLEGRRMDIDLGARKFASVLMLADRLLEDRLPAELRDQIEEQIRRRITEAYLQKVRGEEKRGIGWHKGTSNWNAVCTGGTLFATLSASDDADERVAVIGAALNSMKRYLSGFGDDGFCSEGVGYWNYGFGNYLYLAQMIYDYTGGGVDLFDFDNPQKMRRVGNFPENFEIQNGIFPFFSDGAATVKEGSDNFAYLLSAKYYDARKPTYSRPADITMQLMEWADPASQVDANRERAALPPHTAFDQFGAVISRGDQAVPFSIAVKAGHNDENHNHSDVGSYVMVLGEQFIMCGDLGAPPYEAGSFNPKHKMRSSWGHPVPRIDGTLQSNGRRFEGHITETTFASEGDRIVMDLSAAYDVPALKTLVRTVENKRAGSGVITVRDVFTASEPVTFDVPIMTHVVHEIVDGDTVLLKHEGQTLRVDIDAEGHPFQIKVQDVNVKSIRYADAAFKIEVALEGEHLEGAITMTFTPQ